MGETTSIEWTDSTWNPWRGCTRVSPGCAKCYMFRDQARYGRDPYTVMRCEANTFKGPLDRHRFPDGKRVFTCSWSDFFHEDADAWREEAWAVVRQRPGVTFQILTKRPERIATHLPADWGPSGWPNVWLGTSVEDQLRADLRIPVLLSVPATVHFLSCEPLIGPVTLQPSIVGRAMPEWVIVGGESDWNPRPMDPQWARALRDECERLGIPFFLKQLGGSPVKKSDHEEATLDGRTWKQSPPLLRIRGAVA